MSVMSYLSALHYIIFKIFFVILNIGLQQFMKLRKKSGAIYTFLSQRYVDLRNNLHNVPSHLTDSTEILLKSVELQNQLNKVSMLRIPAAIFEINTQAVFGEGTVPYPA